MSLPSTVHSTFVLERSFNVPPDRVFAAFADPDIKKRWFFGPDGAHKVEHHELDFRVGGREKVDIRLGPGTPVAGLLCSNNVLYQHIVPGRLIVFAETMSMEGRIFSASLGTAELMATPAGTNLTFTFQSAFFEGADGPEMREEGWRGLLDRLVAVLAN